MEVVPSSQGSPAPLMEELLLLQQPPDRLLPPHEQSCSGTSPTVTAATSCRGSLRPRPSPTYLLSPLPHTPHSDNLKKTSFLAAHFFLLLLLLLLLDYFIIIVAKPDLLAAVQSRLLPVDGPPGSQSITSSSGV